MAYELFSGLSELLQNCKCHCAGCGNCTFKAPRLHAASLSECADCADVMRLVREWQGIPAQAALASMRKWFEEKEPNYVWVMAAKGPCVKRKDGRVTNSCDLFEGSGDMNRLFNLQDMKKSDGHSWLVLTKANGWSIGTSLLSAIASCTENGTQNLPAWLTFKKDPTVADDGSCFCTAGLCKTSRCKKNYFYCQKAKGGEEEIRKQGGTIGMTIHACSLHKFLRLLCLPANQAGAITGPDFADIAYLLPYDGKEPVAGDVVYLSSSEGGLQCSLRRPEDPLGASVVTGLMHRPHTIGNPYSNGSIPVVYFGHAGVRFREGDRSAIRPGVPLYAVNDGEGLASIKQHNSDDPVVGIAIQAPGQNDDFVEVMISSVVNKKNQRELKYLEKLIELQKEQLELQKKQSESKPSIMNTTTMQNVTVGAQITGGTHHNSTFNISAPASFEPEKKKSKN